MELGTPSALSFEPIDLRELHHCWLSHYEKVLKSSLQTIKRYRAATNHLIRFVRQAELIPQNKLCFTLAIVDVP